MTIDSKEFYDVLKSFEDTAKHLIRGGNEGFNKAHKEMWKSQVYYNDGKTNEAFKVFLAGYSCGRNEYLNQ